jgi:hypothetical protein
MWIGLSVPVAFQYPLAAALFGLAPFGYFRSLGEKKYHSLSPNNALSACTQTLNYALASHGSINALQVKFQIPWKQHGFEQQEWHMCMEKEEHGFNIFNMVLSRKKVRTREVPGVEFVEVDLGDDGDLEHMGVGLAAKVV